MEDFEEPIEIAEEDYVEGRPAKEDSRFQDDFDRGEDYEGMMDELDGTLNPFEKKRRAKEIGKLKRERSLAKKASGEGRSIPVLSKEADDVVDKSLRAKTKWAAGKGKGKITSWKGAQEAGHTDASLMAFSSKSIMGEQEGMGMLIPKKPKRTREEVVLDDGIWGDQEAQEEREGEDGIIDAEDDKVIRVAWSFLYDMVVMPEEQNIQKDKILRKETQTYLQNHFERRRILIENMTEEQKKQRREKWKKELEEREKELEKNPEAVFVRKTRGLYKPAARKTQKHLASPMAWQGTSVYPLLEQPKHLDTLEYANICKGIFGNHGWDLAERAEIASTIAKEMQRADTHGILGIEEDRQIDQILEEM